MGIRVGIGMGIRYLKIVRLTWHFVMVLLLLLLLLFILLLIVVLLLFFLPSSMLGSRITIGMRIGIGISIGIESARFAKISPIKVSPNLNTYLHTLIHVRPCVACMNHGS